MQDVLFLFNQTKVSVLTVVTIHYVERNKFINSMNFRGTAGLILFIQVNQSFWD